MTILYPLNPGQKSTATQLAADVGKSWHIDGCWWVLVQASGAIASPAGLFVLWTPAAAGTQVSALAGAAATKQTVAGLVPSTFTGSLASGDYVLVCRKGMCNAVFVGAATADTLVAIHAGPGLDDTTVTEATAVAQTLVAVGGASTANCRVILD